MINSKQQILKEYVTTGSAYTDFRHRIEFSSIKLLPTQQLVHSEVISLNKEMMSRYERQQNDSFASFVYGIYANVIWTDEITDYLYSEAYTSIFGYSIWQTEFMDKILDKVMVIKDDSNVIRPIECMYRRNNSEDRFNKPTREDYVLSDNTKEILANCTRLYDKQEKFTNNKNWRKD